MVAAGEHQETARSELRQRSRPHLPHRARRASNRASRRNSARPPRRNSSPRSKTRTAGIAKPPRVCSYERQDKAAVPLLIKCCSNSSRVRRWRGCTHCTRSMDWAREAENRPVDGVERCGRQPCANTPSSCRRNSFVNGVAAGAALGAAPPDGGRSRHHRPLPTRVHARRSEGRRQDRAARRHRAPRRGQSRGRRRPFFPRWPRARARCSRRCPADPGVPRIESRARNFLRQLVVLVGAKNRPEGSGRRAGLHRSASQAIRRSCSR